MCLDFRLLPAAVSTLSKKPSVLANYENVCLLSNVESVFLVSCGDFQSLLLAREAFSFDVR